MSGNTGRPLHLLAPLRVKNKILLGPGPSNVHPRVASAIANQSDVTHADPQLHEVLKEIKDGLRYVFQTSNEVTLAISASGHSGMESAICNILESHDVFVSAATGIWGERAAEMASKIGCKKVITLTPKEFGQEIPFEEFRNVLERQRPKLLYACHGDSSSGVLQSLNGLGHLCHQYNCLLLVDAVASLLSSPLNVDELQIDFAFSASQKCLNVPPGLALITVSDRAMDVIRRRKTSIVPYYFDIHKMSKSWGCHGSPFIYHTTHSVSLLIGLREGLSEIVEKGLEQVILKHQETSRYLQGQLEARGFQLLVKDEKQRLPSVIVVKVPDGTDEVQVRKELVNKFNLEVAGGLGPSSGRVWRIGLMGRNASYHNISFLLDALGQVMKLPPLPSML